MTTDHDGINDTTARALIAQVRALGFHVSVFHLGPSALGTDPGRIEMHAVHPNTDQVHVVYAMEGERDAEYLCACRLADRWA